MWPKGTWLLAEHLYGHTNSELCAFIPQGLTGLWDLSADSPISLLAQRQCIVKVLSGEQQIPAVWLQENQGGR